MKNEPANDWPPKRPTTYRDECGVLYQVTPGMGLLRGSCHIQPVDEHGHDDPKRRAWTCHRQPGGFERVETPEADLSDAECKHRWLRLVQPPMPDFPAIYECSNATCRARLWGEVQETGGDDG